MLTLRALWAFTRERFPLSSHLPMVGVFALANVAAVIDLQRPASLAAGRFAAAATLALSYFFRLRCLDELKDEAFDRRQNPQRPLPRGLVSRRLLELSVLAALVLELVLALGLFGTAGALLVAVAQAFSLLMYREFFVGSWLRLHLTTYAVTHTLSAALLGAAVALLYARIDPRLLAPALWALPLFNWWVFNLFEFARKTWASEEEHPGVDSYSRRFGIGGAVLLAWSQIAGALLFAGLHPHAFERPWSLPVHAIGVLLPLAGGLALVWRRSAGAAAIYRRLVSVYLIVFYAALAAEHLAGALPRLAAAPVLG